jgi:hypothetical protein
MYYSGVIGLLSICLANVFSIIILIKRCMVVIITIREGLRTSVFSRYLSGFFVALFFERLYMKCRCDENCRENKCYF